MRTSNRYFTRREIAQAKLDEAEMCKLYSIGYNHGQRHFKELCSYWTKVGGWRKIRMMDEKAK